MRRWLIVGAVVAIVAAGVFAVAIANLSRWLAANHDWLTAQAGVALGRPVRFGTVGVSLWGGAGVRVTDLRIADDPAYADGDFLRADGAQVTVRLLPALFGRWEVRRVVLRAPVVTVIRDARGMNVDSLGRRRDGPAREPRSRPAGEAPSPARPRELPLVAVGLLDVRDGEVRWIDRRVTPPVEVAVHDLHVEATDLGAETPMTFELGARLLDAPGRNVAARGTLGPLGDPPALDAVPVDATLAVRDVDVTALRRALPDVAARLPAALRIEGPTTLRARAAGTPASLALEASVDFGAATLGWGTALAKPARLPCTVTVHGRRDGGTVVFERAAVRVAELALDAAGRVVPGDPTRLDLQVDGAAADLARVAAVVPALAGVSGAMETHVRLAGELGGDRRPAVTGTLALTNVAVRLADAPAGISGLSTTIRLEGDGAVMPPTRFLVGGQPMEASLTVRDVRAPHVALHVEGDAVPLTVVGTEPVEGLPPDVLRGVVLEAQGTFAGDVPEAEGTLRSASGTVHGADYANLTARVRVRDRAAVVEPFAVEAYGGTVKGTARADLTEPRQPRLTVEATAQDVQVDGLIASQRPKDMQRVSGVLDGDVALTATGRAWARLQRSAKGTARIRVRDGVLHDINVGDDVLGSVTVPGIVKLVPPRVRAKVPDLFETGDTRFDTMRANAVIANETARTDDLLLAAKAYTVRGAGSITAAGRVDFTGTLVASQKLTADVVASVREARYLTNDDGVLSVPFRLRGKLPKLRAEPDARLVTQALQRGLLDRGLDALLGGDEPKPKGQKRKKPDTEERIRRGIERLFGR